MGRQKIAPGMDRVYVEQMRSIHGKMRSRCNNPKDPQYESYGGRGIAICERWLSFNNFILDVSPRPPGKTLDRKDNDGPYSPENVRWATAAEQACNRRDTVLIEHNGERKSIKEWSDHFGVSYNLLRDRIRKWGYSFEDAVTIPAYHGGKTLAHINRKSR